MGESALLAHANLHLWVDASHSDREGLHNDRVGACGNGGATTTVKCELHRVAFHETKTKLCHELLEMRSVEENKAATFNTITD